MQALEDLSRDELIALVRELQHGRGAPARAAALASALAPAQADALALDLDHISRHALEVLDNSGVAALIFDSEGELRILAANRSMAALAGYGDAELERVRLADLLLPEESERVRRMLRLPRQGGFAASGRWRLCTRNGELRQLDTGGYDLAFAGQRARFVIVQDVARRRRDQLVQQRLAAIVESSSDAILGATPEGIVLSWNRAAERLFGHTAAEIVGRSVDLLVPAELQERERELPRAAPAAGMSYTYETLRVQRDGTRIEVSVTVALLDDTDGCPIGMSMLIRDLRPARELQRRTMQSEVRLRQLAQAFSDWAWEQDEAGRFVYHSGEWANDVDAARSPIAGRTLSELPIDWHCAEDANEYVRALAQRRAFAKLRFRMRDASGEVRDYSMSGQPVHDPLGGFRGYRGACRDLTLDRRQQAALQLSRAIESASDDAILSWSIDGHIRSWNPGAEAMFGYASDETIGRPVSMLLPESAALDDDITASALTGARVVAHPTARRHKNGTVIPVAMTCAPLRDERGQVYALACIARDIREQKLHERLLADAHQRLKVALESAGLALWEWDVSAARVFYSDEFVRMLELPSDHMPDTRPCQHLAHPEDATMVDERLRAFANSGGESLELECRVRTGSGEWNCLAMRGRVLARDRDGHPLRVLGTAQDITARRRAGQFDEMLTAFLQSSDDLICSLTLEGTVLYWNRGAERTLGYSAAEMVGRSILGLMQEERRGEAAQVTEMARRGRPVARLDTVWLHKDGREVHLAFSFAPLRDANGNVTGLAALGRDVTDGIRVERSLRESEERWRALVETSAEAVWRANAAGELLADNASLEHYTGLDVEQAHALSWVHAVHPDERDRALAGWRSALHAGTPYEGEHRVHRGDGQWRHIAARASPVRNEDGSIREWIGILTDITRRREAQAARSLLAAVVESSQDAIISHDFTGAILSWNRGAEEMFGYRQHEIVGCDYRVLTPAAPMEQIDEVRRRAIRGERVAPFEMMAMHRDGHEVPVSVSLAALRNEVGETVGVTAVARDISDQRRAQRALLESERQLEAILNNAAEGMIVLSEDGGIERINLVGQFMFGYGAEEAQGLNLRQLTLELDNDEPAGPAPASMRRFVGSRRELTGRRRDGSIFPLEIAVSEISLSPQRPKFTAVVRDITERKTWESRIYTLAYTDALTGLPNRLLLRDRLEHAIAAAQRNRTLVGVLFFDLDHFKAVNDSYGHHIGDQVLREIGERVKRCVRDVDTVCRLGGDEFVIVLPEVREAADAGAVAVKILTALSHPYRIEEYELAVTPTVGISIYPEHGLDADSLLRNADTAMYHAKESGKNRFRFYGS